MTDYRLRARRQLESAGAATAIANDLRAQIDAAEDEVKHLITQAEDLRTAVEKVWNQRLSSLTRAHDHHLRKIFPQGVPDTCYLEFEVMSGQDAVYKSFHTLLRILHNTASDYPNQTRDPR